MINTLIKRIPRGSALGPQEKEYYIFLMREHIFNRHNKSLLLYHLVCPVKYRRNVLSEEVEISLVEICKNISERYEIHFVEIGADENHVHFLIQSVPKISVESLLEQ